MGIEELKKIMAYIEEKESITFLVTELNEFNMALEGKVIDGLKVMIKRMPTWVQ